MLSCPVSIHQEQGLFSSFLLCFFYPFSSITIARNGAPLLLCQWHLPVSTCRPLGLSSLHPCHLLLIFKVLWCGHHLFILLHLAPHVGGVFVSCPPPPPPDTETHTYTLWHPFRLIARLVCVSPLSWMDWICLLIAKSRSFEKHAGSNANPVWAIKLLRAFLQILVIIKFTKTMLLIYRLIPTFVVTVLTTIFVSDFSLLTKILTDFVHLPPHPTPPIPFWELFGARLEKILECSHGILPWSLFEKTAHSPFRSPSPCSLELQNSVVPLLRGLPSIDHQIHLIGSWQKSIQDWKKKVSLILFSPLPWLNRGNILSKVKPK